jgi:hypothetical protein
VTPRASPLRESWWGWGGRGEREGDAREAEGCSGTRSRTPPTCGDKQLPLLFLGHLDYSMDAPQAAESVVSRAFKLPFQVSE